MQILPPEERRQTPSQFRDLLEFALPHDRYAPAEFSQSSQSRRISHSIGSNFPAPVRRVISRQSRAPRALVSMPEATVNKNNLFQTGKHDIRFAGEIPAMQPEAISHGVNHPPHEQFRAGVHGLDRPHDPTALLRRFRQWRNWIIKLGSDSNCSTMSL